MEELSELLSRLDELIWGPWMLILIVGTGIYLLIRMRFLPFRNFFHALSCMIKTEDSKGGKTGMGEISSLSSLTTELAATIGTGNIVGVATAMVLGGPGALVWMLLSALTGFSTRFAESMLSVKYREKNADGNTVGGPMYTLRTAFPRKKAGKLLGILFAVFAVLASFGMGNMTQANSIASALKESFSVSEAKTGLALTIAVILIILGGIRSISTLTLYFVPCMALIYIIGSAAVIAANLSRLPQGLEQIFRTAFSARALAGGVSGSLTISLKDTIRFGISRGVFSNEAGLGAAGISAAAANTSSPARQGYISMTGVFFDTILICTLTGLTITAAGVLGTRDETGELLTGSALTIAAFSTVFGKPGGHFVSIGITLFAFATIIAWEYQGERAFEFLTGSPRLCLLYRFVYALITFIGAVCALETVWDFSDIMNGLMAVPNLICILALSEDVCREMDKYEREKRQ